MRRTYYVTLFRRWMPSKKIWRTQIGVGEDRPYKNEADLLVAEVICGSKEEAPAVLMEFLLKGRPSIMSVEVLWEVQP